MIEHDKYLGLLDKEGREPDRALGYSRCSVGNVEIWDIPMWPENNMAVFNEVTSSYGDIHAYCMYDCAEGGEPLYIWPVKEPLDIHEGVIPIINNGRLMRGVDVSIRFELESKCNIKA